MTSPASAFCTSCNHVAINPKSVTPSVSDLGPTELGDLYICPSCGSISELTLIGWQPFTERQLSLLPPDEYNDVVFAVRVIQSKFIQEKAKLS